MKIDPNYHMNNRSVGLIKQKDAPFPRTTLWRLRKAGQLPFYRIGRRIYYSAEHLAALLSSCEVRKTA